MRVPLTLKICAGALFLAVLQAVIAVAAFRALQVSSQGGNIGSPAVVAEEEERLSRERKGVVLLLLAGAGTVVGVGVSLLVARRVGLALDRLNYATLAISEGAFDTNPQVTSNDELGDLATGLGVMAQKLKNYEQLCLDASPLTRLPGNIAIERALNDRLRMGEKFALCYVDLDNFKAYNDRYGYAKGSDIIKATGEILYECCRRHGKVEDFVGHIGGDDFVLITSPDLVPTICQGIIQDFDRMIPTHYSAQDLERGYVEAVDRYGVCRQFPIMTLSIAVVSDDKRQIHSPQEIAQVAAEIKDYVKAMPGSNYLIDRRRGQRSGTG